MEVNEGKVLGGDGRKTSLQQRGQREVGRQQQQPMARSVLDRGRGQQVSFKDGVRSRGDVLWQNQDLEVLEVR